MEIDIDDLVESAQATLHPHCVDDRMFGDVASTLITSKGNKYSGVCIDTGSGTGFCAEHSAIAAMVTAREYEIAAIVAVWKDQNETLFVVPPCGRCREFIRQIDEKNLNTDVVLGRNEVVKLSTLLPRSDWPGSLA